MKLHLGCGQNYLDGYVNIDYPLDHHSVQTESVADKFADLTKLRYKKASIEEIRLHHVFEHFPRAVALALLISWRSWLKVGGVLRIEVPDFKASILTYLNPLTSRKVKSLTLRHLFGSQEQVWANHYEGWSTDNLIYLLETFGFENIKVNKITHKHMHNIEVSASKTSATLSQKFIGSSIKKYLKQMLVDDSKSEQDLLKVWYANFINQLDKTVARV